MKKKLYRALTALLVVILAVCGAVILKNEQECRAGNRAYEVAARTAGLLEPPDTGPAPASPSAPQGQPEADPVPDPLERLAEVDLRALQAVNPDVFGWIEIPDTEISYPLMHGEDDQYYLKHTFSGNKNSAGSIFIEALNKPDFSERHTIIYGHNMKNGSMFGSLKEYRNASYLVEHPMVYIDLEDGTHAYEIFSCYETSANSNTYTIGFASQPDGRYEQFVHTLKNSSAYDTGIEVSKNDRVITLSTCTKRSENRFVVHAKRIY